MPNRYKKTFGQRLIDFKAVLGTREAKEIYLGFIALSTLLAFGTFGFSIIEGWDYFDSLFMTVITVSTVGYEEVHPLSDAGRLFAMVLIFLGVGVATVVLSIFARRIFERQLTWLFDRRKMDQQIDKLTGHTIFCGYGRLCNVAAKKLREADESLVIIDKDQRKIDDIQKQGYLVIQGDAALDETLIKAGILRAKRVVSLLPKDADNLYVILTSRELNPNLFIMSRAEDEVGEKRLLRAGADRLISPYRVGGVKIAEGLLRPYVTDFLDVAVSGTGAGLQIEEIRIPEKSPVAGMTLETAELRQKTNVIVAAIISQAGDMSFNPSASTVIEPGATLIGLGYRNDFVILESLLLGDAA